MFVKGKKNMTVTTLKEGTKLTVTPEGKMTTSAAPDFEKAIKENISGMTGLVLDLGKVDYMASAGLRVLLSTAKVMHKQGSFKIINVTEPVMDVLTFTGMADIMDVEKA